MAKGINWFVSIVRLYFLSFTRCHPQPGQAPGDVTFVLKLRPHDSFERSSNDLLAHVKVTLSEALFGFSRVLVTHLDGRGIKVTRPSGKVIKPQDAIILKGEGMPLYKHSSQKGDLYVIFDVEFPTEQWLKSVDQKVCFRPSCQLVAFLFS